MSKRRAAHPPIRIPSCEVCGGELVRDASYAAARYESNGTTYTPWYYHCAENPQHRAKLIEFRGVLPAK